MSTLGTSAEKARTRVTEGKKVTGIERKRERDSRQGFLNGMKNPHQRILRHERFQDVS